MKIDQLVPGTRVTLGFKTEDNTEEAEFVGIEGEGDERRATFRTRNDETYDWQAYRFKGRWVFGSSADRLILVQGSTQS